MPGHVAGSQWTGSSSPTEVYDIGRDSEEEPVGPIAEAVRCLNDGFLAQNAGEMKVFEGFGVEKTCPTPLSASNEVP